MKCLKAINQVGAGNVGADYVDERNNPDNRRARFIAATADLSASGGLFR